MRWHAPDCCQPEVYVAEDDIPACGSCGMSAAQMQQPKEDSMLPLFSIPPDEPAGQMNLSWPPCVPYLTNTSATQPAEDATGEASPRPDPRISESCNTDDTSWRSHIYERSLSPDELRIACLEAIPGGTRKTYPIHLSFDVFEDDHHPDYDTMSYTWGGEDDDHTKSYPIYIGDFWDVLHATRNCQSVLRYLRPFRGMRLIWLDFICINQRNMHEKSHQIAKMRQIYSQCNQVFLWLGEDVVSHHQTALPSLRQLEEIEDLEGLLTRRYFTRVWVIQELVLSPRLLMPFHDVVFRVGPLCLQSLQKVLENSQAPWFRLATQGIQGLSQNHSWSEVMNLTSGSDSSDPRDSIFGVLGLWPFGQNALLANYTISHQHLMIGLFAYRITQLHETELFWAARGIDFPELGDAIPSWAPPFLMQGFWQWFSHRLSGYSAELRYRYYKTQNTDNWCPERARRWHEQVTVDSKTGGLFLWATKVLSIPPRSKRYYSRIHLQHWDDILMNGADCFLLDTVASTSFEKRSLMPIYLFLRRTGPQRYRLIESAPRFSDRTSGCGLGPMFDLESVRMAISHSIAVLQHIWETPIGLLSNKLGMSSEFFEFLKAFPGHHETPFHELLPALLGIWNPEYLWENPSARDREARIAPVGDVPKAIILRFSMSEMDAINKNFGMNWGTLKWQQYFGQHDPAKHKPPKHDVLWATLSQKLRRGKELYAFCPMGSIRYLLKRIKEYLDIGAIWSSLDTVNPEGSWSELLRAESLYPKSVMDLKAFRKSRSGSHMDIRKWQIMAAEQRIEIV